ncbi:MAG: peptidase [Planctomycetota bacterium]|nr:peptidase [Planctomycetota bacterium]
MINPTTKAITELAVPTAGSKPTEIVTGPDGNLYFTEFGADRIGQLTPDAVAQAATTTQLTASPSNATVADSIVLVAAVTSAAGTPDGTVSFRDGATLLNATPVALDANGRATFVAGALSLGNHSITAVYSGSSRFRGSTSAALQLTINAPAVAFPVPAELVVVRKSRGAVAAVTLSFNVPLDPASARTRNLYRVLGGVKKRGVTAFNKQLSIKTVRFDATANTVTITLARSFKGPVLVTVRAGLKAANGTPSTSNVVRFAN